MIKPNCEKAILTVNYPMGVTRTYTHYAWNRWTAGLWVVGWLANLHERRAIVMNRLITILLNKLFRRECCTCAKWDRWDMWTGICSKAKDKHCWFERLACADACGCYKARKGM